MIVDFSVKNYLSVKDEISLSFLSNNIKNEDEIKRVAIDNGKFNLYTFSAVYGPNASGKTNICKALSDLRNMVIFSFQLDLDRAIPSYKPFKLDKASRTAPVSFGIEFVVESKRFVYNLEFTRSTILNEELHFYPEGRKALLFQRDQERKIKYGSYFKGEKKGLETMLLPNRLFLSVAANSANELLQPIFRFFRDEIIIHVKMDSSHELFHRTTLELRDKEENFKKLLFKVLTAADLNVRDIKLVEDDSERKDIIFPDDIPDKIKDEIKEDLRFKPFFGHPLFEDGQETEELEYFDLHKEESTGTLKMYDLAGEVIHTLLAGNVLIIDEFNSGMHPLLNKFLVKLFLDPQINKNNAQLLISTHDTCVLDMDILKREQVWFTDKDKYGATELFSLDEFDKNLVRDNGRYGKMYLEGRFKAIPSIDLSELINGLE